MFKGCDYEAGWCNGESTGSRQWVGTLTTSNTSALESYAHYLTFWDSVSLIKIKCVVSTLWGCQRY